MTIHILPTKFYTPSRRSNLVARPRLFERLEAGLRGRLTLVSAPAGYGKSTLLSEWVHQTETPAAWLSLDEGDNDPVRFWTYFVTALQRLPVLEGSWEAGHLLGLLQRSPAPAGEALLEAMVTGLASVQERFVLVLDDFHTISESQIRDGLFYLLENMPSGLPGMHLIISSRADPAWPLARWRVHGALSEIRAQDLRFTSQEAAQFLNEVMGLMLTPEDMAALDSRTEGWAAGLQMAAISMRDREDKAGFIQAFTGSHHYVIDFLMEEVLQRQPPAMIDFLLKTSILERMNHELCQAVLRDTPPVAGGTPGTADGPTTPDRSQGLGDVQAILEALEQNNLFLTALDDQRSWYRYHRLFADLLGNRLQARVPALVPALHRRASQWYGESGFYREAVLHALKTEDWDFATRQIEAYVLTVIQQGEMALVRHWIDTLPDEMIRAHPVLMVAQAWTSARHANVESIEALLAQAEAALASDGEAEDGLTAEAQQLVGNQIAVLQVVMARARGDPVPRQQALAQEALERVSLTGDTAARATLLLRLGFCYLDLGKDDQADRLFAQAFESGQASGNYYAAHSAAYGRMVIASRHGRLHDLAAICRQTLEAPSEPTSQPHSLAGIALIMLGGLYYEWNDLVEAEKVLEQGLKLIQNVGTAELLVKGQSNLARVKIARGGFGSLPDLVRLTEGNSPELVAYAAALQAQLYWLMVGQDAGAGSEAVSWASQQVFELRGQPTYDWEILEKLVLGRILCRQYRTQPSPAHQARLEAAFDFLAGQRQSLERLGWHGIMVELYTVMALSLQTLDRRSQALTALEEALRLGESQVYVRTFLDAGEPMRALLQQALETGAYPQYAKRLLFAFEGSTSTDPKPGTQPAELVEALRPRELQVLRWLNSSLSVPEIAQELHLAPTTVRTHVQNIYSKLGVHGRIEALQRAKELGLL